jgi:uncharacterized coiled-coil DUF342 family protein
MENEKNKRFIQIFQTDWDKINEAITRLRNEVEKYRQEMYQENEKLDESNQQAQILQTNLPK